MKHIRRVLQRKRDKYFMLVAASFFIFFVLSFAACSTSQSEQNQSAAPATAIQGDAIDAPASAAVAPVSSNPEQKPKASSTENLEVATKNNSGASSPAPAAASKTSPSPSPAPAKNATVAATPAADQSAATATAPAANAAPEGDNHSAYQRVTLGLLGSFRYEYPDPVYLESEEDPSRLKLKDQIPPNIKALHGKRISIMGYIMPIDVDEEWRVKTFTLVRDQMVCCFGNVPEINEWVYVRLKTPQRADQLIDVPVIVFGRLEVGEEIRQGTLANLYRVEADRVSTNY